jgi:hypothetical protein
MGDADVLPPSIPATHKRNRKPRFAQTYAQGSNGSYLIDNGTLSITVTVSTYNFVRRMFFPLLGMPMRWPRNLCSLRIR